jgi:hypothetical protein
MNDPLFRQSFCLKLKKQIRGSKDHLIVGIDVAKNKHNAFFARPPERHYLKDWSLKTQLKDLKGFSSRQMQ